MANKISTIDEGLRYLYEARKECRSSLCSRIKMDVAHFLLGHAAAAVMLFRGKTNKKVNASKKNIPGNNETLRRIPWRTLAYAAGIACIIGIVSGKVLSRKG